MSLNLVVLAAIHFSFFTLLVLLPEIALFGFRKWGIKESFINNVRFYAFDSSMIILLEGDSAVTADKIYLVFEGSVCICLRYFMDHNLLSITDQLSKTTTMNNT